MVRLVCFLFGVHTAHHYTNQIVKKKLVDVHVGLKTYYNSFIGQNTVCVAGGNSGAHGDEVSSMYTGWMRESDLQPRRCEANVLITKPP